MARRAKVEAGRLKALLGIMRRDELAPAAHVTTLARDLDKMHRTTGFGDCKTMGELTAAHVSLMVGL
jgi:DNA-binding MltR family transcriptional regulator